MTRYLDKHGAEIREGDMVEVPSGERRVEKLGVNGFLWGNGIKQEQWFYSECAVLSRADGTPVYRYKDGEDVREGDFYHCFRELRGMGECGIEHEIDNPENIHYKMTAEDWGDATLIRRAGEENTVFNGGSAFHRAFKKQIDDGLAAMREFETKSTCACGRRAYMLDANRKCPDCNRCPAEYGARCELAEGHAGPHGFNDRNAPGGRWEWTVPGEPAFEGATAARSLESFARWLARPTLAQRFEVFGWRIFNLLRPYPSLSMKFDCSAGTGPLCIVHHPMFAEMYRNDERAVGYCFGEDSSDETVMQALRGWAEWLGRKELGK